MCSKVGAEETGSSKVWLQFRDRVLTGHGPGFHPWHHKIPKNLKVRKGAGGGKVAGAGEETGEEDRTSGDEDVEEG